MGEPQSVQTAEDAVAMSASVDEGDLSASFRGAAEAERQTLVAMYEEAIALHEQHAALAEQAALRADRYLATIRELGELLGVEDQLSIASLNGELRGERLREVAAEIIFRHFKPGETVHYKKWLNLVVAEGHRVGGKNPAATFLTQVARVDDVERVGRRTGLYRVREPRSENA